MKAFISKLGQCCLYSLNSFKMNKSTPLSKHYYISTSQFTAEIPSSLYKRATKHLTKGLLQENNDRYKMVPPTQSANSSKQIQRSLDKLTCGVIPWQIYMIGIFSVSGP